MAIRKRGESWYFYGRLGGRIVQRSLGRITADEARALDVSLLASLDAQRRAERTGRLLQGVFTLPVQNSASSAIPAASAPIRGQRGIPLEDMYAIAEKRRALSRDHRGAWSDLCRAFPRRSAASITPQELQAYMDARYGTLTPKRYNNALTSIRVIFAASLVEAGLSVSPAAVLQPRRAGDVEHHRGFTPDEVRRILDGLASASPGWYCLSMVAAYTGLRLESCRRLAPSHIADGLITIMPGKTARFGRAVQIPLLPPLRDYLATLHPESPDTPYAAALDVPRDWPNSRQTWLSGYLRSIGVDDTPEGSASFHSWRVTFISHLSGEGVSQDVIRGIVGHASQDMTDLYNHDSSAAVRAFGKLKLY